MSHDGNVINLILSFRFLCLVFSDENQTWSSSIDV